MRHEILPYRPASLIPPQTIRACLRSVLVVSGALGTALALLLLAVFARGLPAAYGAEADAERAHSAAACGTVRAPVIPSTPSIPAGRCATR